jgi:hypothetical protein
MSTEREEKLKRVKPHDKKRQNVQKEIEIVKVKQDKFT